MMERTLVFVDTSYLLASFYNSWEEGARQQLEISLANVVQGINWHARHLVNQPVQRQNWYDGIPERGPHRYQRTLRVIEGVQVRAGQLIEWGDRRTQKAVDTLLVADMVIAALKGHCSDMVLVSGDADMAPGVRVAVEAGIRVHLLGFGWDSIASSLRHSCDTATVLDPRVDFADCMQIRVLQGPVAPVVPDSAPRPAVPGEDGERADSESAVSPAVTEVRDLRPRATSVAADEASRSVADEEAAVAAVDAARTGAGGAGAPGPDAADDRRPGPDERTDHIGGSAVPSGDRTPGQAGVSAGDDLLSDVAEPAGNPSAAPRPDEGADPDQGRGHTTTRRERPNPSMMAGRRRPLRSRYVPLSEEVWTSSGEATPFDVGQQYARWWFEQAATDTQRDQAHLLSGGVLPPEVDRPLLQFACQMLNEFTLDEHQRVALRDGFHEGIRAVLLSRR